MPASASASRPSGSGNNGNNNNNNGNNNNNNNGNNNNKNGNSNNSEKDGNEKNGNGNRKDPGSPVKAPANPKVAASPKQPAKVIDGVRHDTELAEMAKRYAKDGQISFSEAKQMFHHAEGAGLDDVRTRTLRWTMEAFKYTDKAAAFMELALQGKGSKTSYFKQINGVKYDRDLLELAQRCAKDGQVSFPEAQMICDQAMDGGKVTEIERRTLQYALSTFKFTSPALKHVQEFLQGKPAKGGGKRFQVRWSWVKSQSNAFPAYPVVVPRREHLFTLVLCHPMGWGGGFFLGGGALVEDLLSKSRLIRDHCKIVCPGGKMYKDWKMWFRYKGRDTGGTAQCHDQEVNQKDFQQTREFLTDIITREGSLLGSPRRIVVCGYSQGGSVSLDIGLSLTYPIGLVVSQRGMLLTQSMSDYEAKKAEGSALPKQRMLVTAGGKDDVFLPDNQSAAAKWLKGHKMQVTFKLFKELNHGDHSKEEMAFIRGAAVKAFLRADTSTTRRPKTPGSPDAVLKRPPARIMSAVFRDRKRRRQSNGDDDKAKGSP